MIKFFYHLFHRFKYKELVRTSLYRNMTIEDMVCAISKFPYRPDGPFGLLDNTCGARHFYDPTVKSHRDCDDFARQWALYGLNNGYDVYEIVCWSKRHFFKTAHVFCILSSRTSMNYIVCDYGDTHETKSFDECITFIAEKYSLDIRYVVGYSSCQLLVREILTAKWSIIDRSSTSASTSSDTTN